MARTIPLTNFAAHMKIAKAIHRDLRENPGGLDAVRRAVVDLAELAGEALEEAAQVFEALAMVVLSLDRSVTRGPKRTERAPRAKSHARR